MKSIFAVVAIILLSAALAVAVPASKKLEYTKSSMGKVIFDGKVHAGSGMKCNECHNKDMFPKMKFGTVEIKMDKIYAGELCGKCHNGERAFAAKGNCNRCHKK
jgi:c(7)-type cytochrome triheme protein